MGTREALTPLWPLYGLRLCTPRLELAPICDDDLAELVAVAQAGVHDPATMPFSHPWTDAPAAELPGDILRFFWHKRAVDAADRWSLPFAVRRDGRLLGVQELMAEKFAVRGVVTTGSWLGRRFQGDGVGTEMRCAVLMFAFDELKAWRAETEAFVDNPASLALTRGLGYRPNGEALLERRPGEVVANLRFVLDAAAFRRPTWALRVEGLNACRSELGAG